MLASAGSVLAVALLVTAGLDLAATGALGHCPLYAKLGYLPKTPAEDPMTRDMTQPPACRTRTG